MRAWLEKLRQQGPILPKRYTGIIQRARSCRDLLDVVDDFDQHVGGPPNPIFLTTAAKTALRIPNCSPSVAARLINRIPALMSDQAAHVITFLVLNKAAEARDSAAARMAFARLPVPNGGDWAALLQANSGNDANLRSVLEEVIRKVVCTHETAPRLLSATLKAAAGIRDPDLTERVWRWSHPLRQHLLCLDEADNSIALKTTQYILGMSRMGHVDAARAAWTEWQQSPLGKADHAPYADVLRSAMIAAVAAHGDADTAEELYRNRPTSYRSPTPSFNKNQMLVSLISAYSHAGLPDRAIRRLAEAESEGAIDVHVYNSVIDACARAGDFEKAQVIVANMRAKGIAPDGVTWMSMLGPCRRYRNVAVAEAIFDEIQATPTADQDIKAAAFVVLADVYRDAGQNELATGLHQRRLRLGLHKQRGAVAVTVDDKEHTFHVGEIPRELSGYSADIEAKLDEWSRLLAALGLSTESIKCRHSEKLALAYAVLRGQKDVNLRKNLRICSACHSASIALTSVEGIVIRHHDRSRVHVMRDGQCSCQSRY